MFYLIQLLNAVQYGLLLFLLASGLTLIFGIMGVINLAHGSFYMVGAYLAYWLAKLTGSLWLAIPIGIVIAFAIGLLLETAIFSRLYRRDHLYQVLLTFGLILIFEELRSILFGDEVHGVAVPALLDYSIPLTDTLVLSRLSFVHHRGLPRNRRVALLRDSQNSHRHDDPRRHQQPRDGCLARRQYSTVVRLGFRRGHVRSLPLPVPSRRRSPRYFPAWAIRS